MLEQAGCRRDREIRLAGTGRADAKRQVVLNNGVYITLLARSFRLDAVGMREDVNRAVVGRPVVVVEPGHLVDGLAHFRRPLATPAAADASA